jgi:outer membrane phospholipase A
MMLQARKEIGIVVDYSTTTYNESLPDSDVTMNRVSLGLVFSNFKGGR